MPILQATTNQIGQAGQIPKIVYIQTNDTVATVETAGYLNGLVQKFGVSLAETDIALVSTKLTPNAIASQVSFYDVSYANGDWSLTSATSSGTVNAGTVNQLAWYASTGDAVSGLATANRGVLVTSATGVPSILAPAATTGLILQSNAAAAPSWSTAAYPATAGAAGTFLRSNAANWVASTATLADTYAINTLLYASGANAVTGLAAGTRAVLTANATNVPTWVALTDGQLIVGSTAGTPAAATLTAGTGISVVNASNSITVNAVGGGLTWANAGSTTVSAAVNRGYVSDQAGATTFTLPAVFAIGDVVEIIGLGAAGWVLAPAAGDNIRYGNANATTSLTSTNQYDCVKVIGQVANTSWAVVYAQSAGLTVV